MQLLVIILNKVELINDLLSILVEAGITQATIFDSEGMGHHLAYEVPIFAGLRQLVGESAHNKTILSLIRDENMINELQELLKEIQIDFTKPGTGIMFTLPVSSIIKQTQEDD